MSKHEVTLSTDELIQVCEEWVRKLANSGGNAWSLQVPVNFNRDPDMLFLELGKRLKERESAYREMRTAIYEAIDYVQDLEPKAI